MEIKIKNFQDGILIFETKTGNIIWRRYFCQQKRTFNNFIGREIFFLDAVKTAENFS